MSCPLKPLLALALIAASASNASAAVLVYDFGIAVHADTRSDAAVDSQDFSRSTFSLLFPVNLGARSVLSSNVADARQSQGGLYTNTAAAAITDYFGTGIAEAHGTTEYFVQVTTDTPNDPLRMDIQFMGSDVHGSAYYGDGTVTAQITSSIRAGVVGDVISHALGGVPYVSPPEVWRVQDTAELVSAAGSDRFTVSSSDIDVLNVGLPTATSTAGFVEFESRGSVTRDAFFGTFDFGVLLPFQVFELRFSSATDVVLNSVRYTGFAGASVRDPFALTNPAGFRFNLRGLTFPPDAPPPTVASAPATTLFAAAAVALISTSMNARRRRRGYARAPCA